VEGSLLASQTRSNVQAPLAVDELELLLFAVVRWPLDLTLAAAAAAAETAGDAFVLQRSAAAVVVLRLLLEQVLVAERDAVQ